MPVWRFREYAKRFADVWLRLAKEKHRYASEEPQEFLEAPRLLNIFPFGGNDEDMIRGLLGFHIRQPNAP